MSITFMLISLANGGNDIIATHFHLTINGIMWFTRIGLFVVPPIAFVITKRFCLSLQRADRDLVLHGRETGRLVMMPNGEMLEVHEPISDAKRWTLTQHQAPGALPAPLSAASTTGLKGKLRVRMNKAHAVQIPAPTLSDLKELGDGHH